MHNSILILKLKFVFMFSAIQIGQYIDKLFQQKSLDCMH